MGETAQLLTTIESDLAVVIYNLYLSCYPTSDLAFQFYIKDLITGLISTNPVVSKLGTQYIDVLMEKGLNINGQSLVVATNMGLAPIDCHYSAHGVIVPDAEITSVIKGFGGDWRSLLP